MLFFCLVIFLACSLFCVPMVIAFIAAVPSAVREGKPLRMSFPPLLLLAWAASAAGVVVFWHRCP